MKRKQMVHSISDELCMFMPTVELSKRNLIADVILTHIEREGMQPPTKYKKDREGTIAVNEWDDDNET